MGHMIQFCWYRMKLSPQNRWQKKLWTPFFHRIFWYFCLPQDLVALFPVRSVGVPAARRRAGPAHGGAQAAAAAQLAAAERRGAAGAAEGTGGPAGGGHFLDDVETSKHHQPPKKVVETMVFKTCLNGWFQKWLDFDGVDSWKADTMAF